MELQAWPQHGPPTHNNVLMAKSAVKYTNFGNGNTERSEILPPFTSQGAASGQTTAAGLGTMIISSSRCMTLSCPSRSTKALRDSVVIVVESRSQDVLVVFYVRGYRASRVLWACNVTDKSTLGQCSIIGREPTSGRSGVFLCSWISC